MSENRFRQVLKLAAEVRAQRQARRALGLASRAELDEAAMRMADEAIDAEWAERKRLEKLEERQRRDALKARGALGGSRTAAKKAAATT